MTTKLISGLHMTITKYETFISNNPFQAYLYAFERNCPFPLGEPVISKSKYAIQYAQYILKNRFKLYELNYSLIKSIHAAQHFQNFQNYCKTIIKLNHE